MMIMRPKPSSGTRGLTHASRHRQLRLEPLEQRRLLSAAPQNVILMIGDGMGPEHVKAGNYYAGGDLSFEQFPYQGELTTYSANAAVTDSAAAATALATGQEVNNGVISMALPGDSSELTTSLEFHQAAGKATGLITTAYLTHATPAAFGAHETSRNNTTQIAEDYFNQTLPNVLFGGGANGITASVAQAAGYTVVTDAGEMTALNTATETYVSGQFGSGYMPYEFDGLNGLPHLSEMTATALDILDNDPDGFFLMVEGGRIDHAAHDNDLERTVDEVIEFSNAVQAVFDWAGGRSDTLIIVTADHETGGLTVTDNGTGVYPDAAWSTTSHTATNVPVYAWGLNAEIVTGEMDNTEIHSLSTGVTTETLINVGSTWQYLVTPAEPADQGSDTWRDPLFNDATWVSGAAELGFGDGNEATVIGYGPDSGSKYRTTYFRHDFQVTDASTYMSLDIGILRDDGAVVYLNGQEVARSHMPAGDISYDTFSSQPAVGGADETTFFPYTIDPTLLVDGTNTLAVEIHQCNLTSSDLSFDLELSGTRLAGPDTTPPTASLAKPQDNGPRDLDLNLGSVTYAFSLAAFEIQLADSGLRIDDATVTSAAVTLKQGATTLTNGTEYTFSYDTATDVISLTGTVAFDNGTYQIVLGSQIADQAGNPLATTTLDVVIDRSLTDAFTVVMLPDTQYYTSDPANFSNFSEQTQWVADNLATENLAFVTHMGDVVQNGATVPEEWTRADSAISTLDGVIPYSVGAGNHDFDVVGSHSGSDSFEAYFGGSRYWQSTENNYSWYLGDTYNTTNHAQKFAAGGRQFLHITLEWEPSQTSVAWAQSMITANPGLPVILSTHSYLGSSGRSTGTSDNGLSGEDIFQDLVSPNSQIFMVLSGHVSDEFHQVSTNDLGLDVFEILADFQGRANGGDGWMRLMEFVPDSNRIDVKTYSPSLDQFETDADSQFSLNIDFDTRFNFTSAPTGSIMTPLDGGPDDLDAATEDRVLVNQTQSQFDIRLTDIDSNIDLSSVTGTTIEVWKDFSTPLFEGTHYTFATSMDENDVIMTLTPLTPPFGNGIYEIVLNPSGDKIEDSDGNELVSTMLTIEIDTSIPSPQTVTFQQGLGGYADTVDTHVLENVPTGSYASAASLNVDNDEPSGSGKDVQALLRFDNIFGTAAGQVPTDAAIISATLELNVTNIGDSINLHRMAQGWSDTDSWDDLDDGIQADDNEALVSYDVSTGTVALGTLSLDVAAALNAWKVDPTENFGWALLPTNSNGVDFDSAEGATLSTRPKLIVEYLPADQNSPPVATDDPSYSVAEDNVLNVAVASGVLANDTDADDDTLSVTVLNDVTDGILALSSDGSFVYTPDADFNGTDSFEYTVADGNGGTDTAVVAITVTAVNDAPVATSQAVGTNEDTPLDITLGGTDADGNTLTYSVATPPGHGSFGSTTAPNLTYTPDANYNGSDSFTFTVDDGNGETDTATVTITVTAVNDAPILGSIGDKLIDEENPLTFTVSGSDGNETQINDLIYSATGLPAGATLDENTGEFTWTPTETQQGVYADVTFTVTDDDALPLSDSETITITVNEVNDAPVANDDTAVTNQDVSVAINVVANDTDVEGNVLGVGSITQPGNGTVVNNGDGTITYTPNQGFTGDDSFTYFANDGDLDSASPATVTVTVYRVNIAPVAGDDTASTDEDTAVTIDVLINDTDGNGDLLSINSFTQPSNGTTADNGDGTLSYTPDADFNGTDTFDYTIYDGYGGYDTATVVVTVNAINDAPVASTASLTTDEDTTVTIDLQTLVTDAETAGANLVFSVGGPTNGSVQLQADGYTAEFTPTGDYNGSAGFNYSVTDTADGSSPAITVGPVAINISVDAANDPPTANDDAFLVTEDSGSTTLSVLSNDQIAPDTGETLTVTTVSSGSAGGTITTDGDNAFYSPAPDFFGIETFTYTIDDGNGGTAMATVSITVTPDNDAPIAMVDTDTTDEDTAVTIDVLANDSDVDGGSLSVSSITQGTDGTVTNNGTDVTYTPDPNFNGVDSFTYTVSDGNGGFDTATVTVTVVAVNDAPTATDDSAVTDQDTSVTILVADLLANDSDVDGDNLWLAGTTTPGQGTLVDNGDGSLTYTPDPDFSGTDTFDYTVSDGNSGSDTGSVTISVTPSVLPFYATGDLPGSGTVSGTFADTEGSNDIRQTIKEETFSRNRSRLEHVWDFGQVDGAVKFVVEASHNSSVEDFEFAYSTDGLNWITMIAGVAATETIHEHEFTAPVSGTIQVRVMDTDRSKKESTLDTISIDEMYFLTQTGPVPPSVTIMATDATAAEDGSDPGEFTITRTGDLVGDLTVSYTVGGTAGAGDYSETLTLSVTIPDGASSATITITPVDDGLGEGSETVMLTLAADAAYAIGSPDSDTVTIIDNDLAAVDDHAIGEALSQGTINGDLGDALLNDGVYEEITEHLVAKKFSKLEHVWEFDVTGGSSVTFYIDAYHNANSVEDFEFEYSTDGENWMSMLTITKTADDDTYQTFSLPAATSGTVFVRVVDTNRAKNEITLDSIYVDEIFFRSE